MSMMPRRRGIFKRGVCFLFGPESPLARPISPPPPPSCPPASPPPLGCSCSSPPRLISLHLQPASFSSVTARVLNFHDSSAFFWHTNFSPPSRFPFLHSSFPVYSLAVWLLLLFFSVLPITKKHKKLNNDAGPPLILHPV